MLEKVVPIINKVLLVLLPIWLLVLIFQKSFDVVPARKILEYALLGIGILIYAGLVDWRLDKSKKLRLSFDLLYGLILGIYVFNYWPLVFFDDAGFILRYLDNFKEGYFFNFNAGEGPIFGVSGFIHGLFCGVLVYFDFTTPEKALLVSNFVGFVLFAFALLGCLRALFPATVFVLPAWLAIIGGAKYLWSVTGTGMETQLHIGIIFTAFLMFLSDKGKWGYFFAALSVISKLDAVPSAVVMVSLYWAYKITSDGFHKSLLINELKNALLFAGIPLLIYLLVTWQIFGSPLPQSAATKAKYHSHSDQSWFPFLQTFLDDMFKKPIVWMYLISLLAFAIYSLKNTAKYLIIPAAFAGTMFLYYLYNPNERMLWYYSYPDVLLLASVIIAYGLLGKMEQNKKFRTIMLSVPLLFTIYLLPDVYGGRYYMEWYMDNTEKERIRIGSKLGYMGWEGIDTLIASHGLIARSFPGYVLDMTGLNSKKATEMGLNLDTAIVKFRPRWIVNHAVCKEIEAYNRHGYKIVDIHGDISLRGWAPWIIVEKTNLENEIIIMTHEFVIQWEERNEGMNPLTVSGQNLVFLLPKIGFDAYFYLGVEKEDEIYWISVEQFDEDGNKIQFTEHEVIQKNFDTEVSQKVQTLKTLLSPETRELRLVRPLDSLKIKSYFSIYERFVNE